MTTHETHHTTGPQPDPMSDGAPMGASRAGDTRHGPGIDPVEPATQYARGGLIEGPSTWVGPDPGGCEYIVPAVPRCKKHAEHLSPGMQALREANDRIVERRRILDQLDVDPWRVPADGLLEYDPVHKEWRVEVWRDPLGAQLDRGRIILRRYAGRRRRWVDLSPYLKGDGSTRVWFGPPVDKMDAPTMRDLGYGQDPRMPIATRPRDWAHRPAEDGPVVSVKTSETYAVGEQLAARRLAAQMGVALERSAGRRVHG
jgi:hypothetical protein